MSNEPSKPLPLIEYYQEMYSYRDNSEDKVFYRLPSIDLTWREVPGHVMKKLQKRAEQRDFPTDPQAQLAIMLKLVVEDAEYVDFESVPKG